MATQEALNSPPPTDTRNLQLCMEQFPLQEIQEAAEHLLHVWRKENTHIETGLGTPSTTGATKNKEGSLDNHKIWGDNQELGPG